MYANPALASRVESFVAGIEMEACGIFYRPSSSQYFLPTRKIPADTEITRGDKLPLAGMFDIWFALDPNKEKCGYLITSSFPTQDKGGVLVAGLTKGMGKATVVEVHIKTKDLVVYHFPNRGTMIIASYVGEPMQVILEEQ